MHRIRSWPLVFVAIAFVSMPARADDAAVVLLRQGVALRREGRDEDALTLFRRAYALTPSPVAQAQIALAEEALGRWVDAERDLAAALENLDDPWILSNEDVLAGARGDIAHHLAWIRVVVDVPGVEAKLGEQRLRPGVEERVVAGSGVLELEAAGYDDVSLGVELRPGEHHEMPVTMVRVRTPVAEPVERVEGKRPSDGKGTSAVSIAGPAVLASVGLIGLGAGTYFGVRAMDQKTARDAQCNANGCTPYGLSLDQSVRQGALLSTASLGAGLAFVAAGATWWIVDAPLTPRAAPVSATGAIVLAALGLGATGVGVGFGVNALDEKAARDARCTPAGCSPAALGYDTEARTSAGIATASVVSALTLFAGATFVWMVHHQSGAAASRWSLVPSLEPRAAGLTFSGPFD
jgi:hypothetical protein